MKALVIFLMLIAVHNLNAQSAVFADEKKSAIVDNLTAAIVSENTGLHTSGAIVLSDLLDESYLEGKDASKTMIPLLKILKNGKSDDERIAAAVALYKLGSEVGIYQLRGVAKFDDSEKVARVCKNLYYSYHKLNGSENIISF